jgi:hypothetical protein
MLEAIAIRKEYRAGATYRALNVRHGLSYGTIGAIVRGEHGLVRGFANVSRGPGPYSKAEIAYREAAR